MIAFSCLFLLVNNTVSTISTVSSLSSKHIYNFVHCPYHTRMAHIIACYHNTHCPHHLRPTWSMDTNPIGYGAVMMSPLPQGMWVCTGGPCCPVSCWLAFAFPVVPHCLTFCLLATRDEIYT